MKRDPLIKYRIFNGQPYRLAWRKYLNKTDALSMQKKHRETGRKARIVELKEGYLVYVR